MMHVTLQRQPSTDEGTFGSLTVNGATFRTGELPDRQNREGFSSVPSGNYVVKMQPSAHFKRDLYHLQDVPGRTAIMIHNGNFCGDVLQGYESEVKGCILLGIAVGNLRNENGLMQMAVTGSNAALAEFQRQMAGADFELEIIDAP